MINIVLDTNCLISYILLKNCSMNTLKGLGSDIKLRSIKQVSASLLADDDVPDTLLDWTSEFAGQWEDDRTADEVIEDIRGARTSNREIKQ